jgi:hypothetical protein
MVRVLHRKEKSAFSRKAYVPAYLRSQIAFDILVYLVRHPDAQDTFEGIAEWWLMECKIKRHIAEVRAALNELCEHGFVLTRSGFDKLQHYKINRCKYDDIKDLLRDEYPDNDWEKG